MLGLCSLCSLYRPSLLADHLLASATEQADGEHPNGCVAARGGVEKGGGLGVRRKEEVQDEEKWWWRRTGMMNEGGERRVPRETRSGKRKMTAATHQRKPTKVE